LRRRATIPRFFKVTRCTQSVRHSGPAGRSGSVRHSRCEFLIATVARSEFGSTDSKQRTTQISNRNKTRVWRHEPPIRFLSRPHFQFRTLAHLDWPQAIENIHGGLCRIKTVLRILPGSLRSRSCIPKMKRQGVEPAQQRISNRGSAIRTRTKPFESSRLKISNRLKRTPLGLKKRIRIERRRSR